MHSQLGMHSDYWDCIQIIETAFRLLQLHLNLLGMQLRTELVLSPHLEWQNSKLNSYRGLESGRREKSKLSYNSKEKLKIMALSLDMETELELSHPLSVTTALEHY